jgi:formylglycine-generating enzyme required for sulfatase activity
MFLRQRSGWGALSTKERPTSVRATRSLSLRRRHRPRGRASARCVAVRSAGHGGRADAGLVRANYYEKAPAADPRGPDTGMLKVMRGGCWMSGPDAVRVSCRKSELPSTRAPNVGFRCAYCPSPRLRRRPGLRR